MKPGARNATIALMALIFVVAWLKFMDPVYILYAKWFQNKSFVWRGLEISLPSNLYFLPPLESISQRIDIRDRGEDQTELILRWQQDGKTISRIILQTRCERLKCGKPLEGVVQHEGMSVRIHSVPISNGKDGGNLQVMWVDEHPLLIEIKSPGVTPEPIEVLALALLARSARIPASALRQ